MSDDEASRLIDEGIQNMLGRAGKEKLKPRTKFVIQTLNRSFSRTVDFSEKSTIPRAELNPPYVSLKIDFDYLMAILKRQTSWNSAMLTFQLEWKRDPVPYDNDLYSAINFLTLPFNQEKSNV